MCSGDTSIDAWRYGIEITSPFDSGSEMTLQVTTACRCDAAPVTSQWLIGRSLTDAGVSAVVELLTTAFLLSGVGRLGKALHLLDEAGILSSEPPRSVIRPPLT